MAGLSDSAHPGLGIRAVLPSVERFHDAAVFGAPVQPAMCCISGGHFDYRVHLHKNLRAALCGQRGTGACSRMVSVENGCGAGDRDEDIYDRSRTGSGYLYRYGADADLDHGCGGPDTDWFRQGRRLRAPADYGATELLSHDQARNRRAVSLDGNFLWRADFGHLVLVYRPGDRAARVVGS